MKLQYLYIVVLKVFSDKVEIYNIDPNKQNMNFTLFAIFIVKSFTSSKLIIAIHIKILKSNFWNAHLILLSHKIAQPYSTKTSVCVLKSLTFVC